MKYRTLQEYENLVAEARRALRNEENRVISHKIAMIAAGGKSRTMPKHEFAALLYVAADRLWNAS